MLTKDVKSNILKNIKPTKKDNNLISEKVNSVLESLNKTLNKLGIRAEFFIGGSFGKGTYLKNSFDVDIFCRFDKTYKGHNLSEVLKKVIKESFSFYGYNKAKLETQKGSRDYFRLKYLGLEIELIPVIKIDKVQKAENTTDISPLHVLYLQDKLTEELQDEIRLTKMFFKANGIYGAESYKNGFSGHVIDILILHYKTLDNLLYNVREWGKQKIIDIEKYYENEEQILNQLDANKQNNLIVIDPVTKNRNAASAVGEENYYKLIYIAQRIDLVSVSHFEVEEFKIQRKIRELSKFARDYNLKWYAYSFELEKGINTKDIMGSKLLKLSKKLKFNFENLGFEIFDYKFLFDYEENKCVFFYLFRYDYVPKIKIIKGPSVLMQKGAKDFVAKREKAFLRKGNLFAYEEVEMSSLKDIYFSKEDFEKKLGKSLEFVKKVKVLN